MSSIRAFLVVYDAQRRVAVPAGDTREAARLLLGFGKAIEGCVVGESSRPTREQHSHLVERVETHLTQARSLEATSSVRRATTINVSDPIELQAPWELLGNNSLDRSRQAWRPVIRTLRSAASVATVLAVPTSWTLKIVVDVDRRGSPSATRILQHEKYLVDQFYHRALEQRRMGLRRRDAGLRMHRDGQQGVAAIHWFGEITTDVIPHVCSVVVNSGARIAVLSCPPGGSIEQRSAHTQAAHALIDMGLKAVLSVPTPLSIGMNVLFAEHFLNAQATGCEVMASFTQAVFFTTREILVLIPPERMIFEPLVPMLFVHPAALT